MADAEKAYRKAVLDAKLKMAADLRRAQQKALQAGDQDEALAIAAKIRQAEEEREATPGPPPPAENDGSIRIVAAFYGQNVSWLDVTEKLQHATSGRTTWSSKVRTRDWGEPAPGFAGPRTLLVRYVVGGKARVKFAYEGNELELP
jgi:hypothetical protein